MSGKPAIKVFLKPINGSGFVDLVAYWRGDNGMLRGAFDRSIDTITIVRKDGATVTLRPDEKGRVDGYYINAREESGSASSRGPSRQQTMPVTRGPSRPADDDGDIPFD